MKWIIRGVLILGVIIGFQQLYAETLEVEVVTRPGKPYSATPAFSEYGNATIAEPWIMCDQCLYIVHTPSDGADYWFVRIITDNKSLPGMSGMIGKILGDGSLSYGGLIDPAIENAYNHQNPDIRANVVWEVWEANDGNKCGINASGGPIDQNELEDTLNDLYINGMLPYFPPQWAYLCDASNTGFVADPSDPYFCILNGVMFAENNPQIALAAYPNWGSTRWVSPFVDDKFAVAVYIGASLGRNQSEPPQGLLAGSYGAIMYVQLFHE